MNVEQERILKSLSDKQHQQQSHLRPEQPRITDEQSYHTEQEEAEDRAETRGEKSINASEYQTPKRPQMELQGEFRKIKPPHFDGELEEAAEAWLINMNKYFQVYEMIIILKQGWLYSSCRLKPHYGGRRSRWCEE